MSEQQNENEVMGTITVLMDGQMVILDLSLMKLMDISGYYLDRTTEQESMFHDLLDICYQLAETVFINKD